MELEEALGFLRNKNMIILVLYYIKDEITRDRKILSLVKFAKRHPLMAMPVHDLQRRKYGKGNLRVYYV